MKKVLFCVLLLALALPVVAWADGIDFTNQDGVISISDSGIVAVKSRLHSWDGITAGKGHALGSVQYSTGALTSGSIAAGGTFSSMGSSFIVKSTSLQLPCHNCVLFNGFFTGTINWTFLGNQGGRLFYQLTGDIQGTLYNGRTVSGTTTQEYWTTKLQLAQGILHGMGGTSHLNTTPEPGTLSLLGTGLVGLAVFIRRRIVHP